MLSQYEHRIYNLAAHRQALQVPYRFVPLERQGAYGDNATPEEQSAERRGKDPDIGDFFATRRADATVVSTMHRELKRAVGRHQPHIHIIDTHYMPDAIAAVRQETKKLHDKGSDQPEFFILQSRYRPTGIDRHFGCALLVMNPLTPELPKRILFCDTVKEPGWHSLFKEMIATEFGEAASNSIEIASHSIQGLNQESNVADHDINCSFYTRSMARALLRIAQEQPLLLFKGETNHIQRAMKSKMQDYYRRCGDEKPRLEIRNTNLYKRWNIGRSMMIRLTAFAEHFAGQHQQNWAMNIDQRREDRALGIGLDDSLQQ